MRDIRNDPVNFQAWNLPFALHKYVSSSYSIFYTNWHTEPEFNLTIGGSEIIHIDNDVYETKPGDLIAIEPNRIHTGPGENWEHHCLIPSVEFLESLGIVYDNYAFTPYVSDPKLAELFWDIVRESDREGPFKRAKTIVAAEKFLLAYYSEYAKPIQQPNSVPTEKNDAHFAVTVQVLNYLRANFARDFSIDEIAKEIDITTSYMCRCVKLTTGKTIVDHLNAIRCRAAYHYLTHSNKSIYEISTLCGFNGSSYFAKVYQKVMGSLPGDVRKQQEKNKAKILADKEEDAE